MRIHLKESGLMSKSELIFYRTKDGLSEIQLRAVDGTVWLTQAEIAEVFDTSSQAITQLIKTIYSEGELSEEATCKEFLQVRSGGNFPPRVSYSRALSSMMNGSSIHEGASTI
jgi:hypothetical protein